MSRALKEATIRRYVCENHDPLQAHLHTVITAYSFAKRLKTLTQNGLRPFEFVRTTWSEQPGRSMLIRPTRPWG